MTVKSIQETQGRVSDLDVQKKPKDFSLPEIFMQSAEKKGVKEFSVEVAMDRESGDKLENVEESPKSVGTWRRDMNKLRIVHSQVIRIREEDSHLDDDICEGLSAKKFMDSGFGPNNQIRRISPAVDVVLLSRRILPSSPLSGKTAFKALQ